MGVEYHLIRDDNCTAFELGKHTSRWREAFVEIERVGRRVLYQLPDVQVPCDLARRLQELWGEWPEVEPAYFDEVASKIIAWVEDKSFRFVIEHDYWDMEPRPRVTGTRYQ